MVNVIAKTSTLSGLARRIVMDMAGRIHEVSADRLRITEGAAGPDEVAVAAVPCLLGIPKGCPEKITSPGQAPGDGSRSRLSIPR